jgi:chitodextrinase
MMRLFLWVLFCPMFAYAATSSNDYRVQLFVGTDTTPPTTPAIIAAIPVATTQIDVTWTASIDAVMVSGYRVYRDNVQIATTSLTSYSDVGLTASTTYTYTIDAFDLFYNISSTSAAVATTTLALPPVTPTSTPTTTNVIADNHEVSTAGVRLTGEVSVLTTPRTAELHWRTTASSQYVVRWGRTQNYEIGVVSGSVYSRNHTTRLDQLEPGTRYYYQITGVSPQGFLRVIDEGSFVTAALFADDTIENVRDVVAIVNGAAVTLQWDNPSIATFDYVRVVRSHLFYPQHSQDGVVVYEGSGTEFVDSNALEEHSPQYYTIFAYDANGNVSSGAIVRAERVGASTNDDLGVRGGDGVTSDSGTSTERSPTILPDIGTVDLLSAEEIFVGQGDTTISFAQPVIIEANAAYEVFIPYDAVPRHIKSIIVSVYDVTHTARVSQYLLKLSADGTRYEAVLPVMGRVGISRLMVEVLDYETGTLRRISIPVQFRESKEPVFWPDMVMEQGVPLLLTGGKLLFVTALSAFVFIVWRRRRREDKQ